MTQTDPVALLKALIQCPSVTPHDAGALDALETVLTALGFEVQRVSFADADTPTIDNLYARVGDKGPHILFAGHTDVVPSGEPTDWTHPPFDAIIEDGKVFGRGAVDMKGGIACFVAAYARHVKAHGKPEGSVSLLITGDEEGPSLNGTVKLLQWAADRNESWDGCIVGEPTNPDALGDMIKIGRRGSLNATVTIEGVQGHVAYPHRADNPVRALLPMLESLIDPPLDAGSANFPPSNLEITSVDIANKAPNVIPGRVTASFNVRFNDHWTADTLKAEIIARLDRSASENRLRTTRDKAQFHITWAKRHAPVFLTRDDTLINTLSAAVEAKTGRKPALSTTGGTSDARFIKDYCPVVEFGLVGQTMHMVDECVALDDLEGLTGIYEAFLQSWFKA